MHLLALAAVAALNLQSVLLPPATVGKGYNIYARNDGFASFETSNVFVSPNTGTLTVSSSQLDVTSMTVNTSSSSLISYRQKLDSGDDLADAVSIDPEADPRTSDDWWAQDVTDSRTNGSANNANGV